MCSNGGSPTSSTRPYEPTSLRAPKLLPLDRGAKDRPRPRLFLVVAPQIELRGCGWVGHSFACVGARNQGRCDRRHSFGNRLRG